MENLVALILLKELNINIIRTLKQVNLKLYRVNMTSQETISYQTYYNVVNSQDNQNKYI